MRCCSSTATAWCSCERLRRTDGVGIAATTFLVAGVLTFCSMDVYYFAVLDRQTTTRLESAAARIVNHVVEEVAAIRAQLDAYDVERARLGGEHARNTGDKGKETQARIVFDERSRSFKCDLETACRNAVLAERARGDRQYPYFDYVVWSDGDGLQRIKWSTLGNITPFVSLADSKLPYFPAMKSAYNRHATGAAATGVNAVTSPNTGESLTVFWKTVDPASLLGRLRRAAGVTTEAVQQLVEAWIGYVPALAPAVPTFLKLVTSAKGETKAAGAANV